MPTPILDGAPRTSVWRTKAANAQRDPHFLTPIAVQLWSQTEKAFVVQHKTAGKVFLPKSRVVQDQVHKHIFSVPNWLLLWKEGLAPPPYR